MEAFLLDPTLCFLNHGSFGALRASVAAVQQRWRDEVERQPVRVLAARLGGLLDAARAPVATFLGAKSGNRCFQRK